MSNRRGPLNSDVENVSKQIFDECLDEIVLGVAFDIHRSVKTGLFAVIEPESPNKKGTPMEVGNSGYATDVFGQVITTMVGVPALKKQPECRCPQCDRNLAASRFAPHLEKCMGMGRNSSRLASRRLASSGKEANYRETGENEDEEDEEWIEPIKVTSKNNRRHRDKNSPARRTKVSGSSAKLGGYSGTSSSSSSTKGDMWNFITAADGTVTPPTNYDVLSLEERSNIFHQVCGVITAASKKICTRSTKCPLHTETQRREVRNRWLTVDDDHVDIDSFTEGDTVALRESLAQLSGASSPTESVVSTSSNPSAASSISIRGGRREKARRGKKKGQSGSGSLKSASRGSTPPLLAD